MDIVNILRDKILNSVNELVEEKKIQQPINMGNVVVECASTHACFGGGRQHGL